MLLFASMIVQLSVVDVVPSETTEVGLYVHPSTTGFGSVTVSVVFVVATWCAGSVLSSTTTRTDVAASVVPVAAVTPVRTHVELPAGEFVNKSTVVPPSPSSFA